MLKSLFYEPVSNFAPATQAKQVTRSTVLRPVRSFCELTGAKGYIDDETECDSSAVG